MKFRSFPTSNDRTRSRSSIVTATAAALLLIAVAGEVRAQDVDVVVLSTEPGGGTLVAAQYDFATPVRVQDRLGFCPGGQCFYSSTNPGYRTPSIGQDGLHPLTAGTPVSFEIVAIDAGISVKWGSTVIDAVGESTRIGNALALHVHPEYQLEAAEGVVGEFELSFRLTSTSPQYGDSEVRNFILSNGDAPPTETAAPATPTPSPTEQPTAPPTATEPPTATPTHTHTPTETVPPNETCDGDCDGDGAVSIAELIRGVNIALGSLEVGECPAFDINDDGMVSINELISAVNDALNGC